MERVTIMCRKDLVGIQILQLGEKRYVCFFAQRVDRLLSINDNDYSGNEKSKQQWDFLDRLVVDKENFLLDILMVMDKSDQVFPCHCTTTTTTDTREPRRRRQREHVHRALLYISVPSLDDYDTQLPNFTFHGRRWSPSQPLGPESRRLGKTWT